MFLSYVVIIVLLMAVYSLFIYFETRAVSIGRQKQYYNIKLEEITSNLDKLILQADNIISNINASDMIDSSIRRIDNGAGFSEDAYEVTSSMKRYINSANNFDISGAYLFINGLDKVFSNTATYTLDEIFYSANGKELGIRVGSMAEIYGINHNAIVFNKEYLMYITRYESFKKIWRICILFDTDSIAEELSAIMGNDDGVCISIGSTVLYESGETDKSVTFEKASIYRDDVLYTLTVDKKNLCMVNNPTLILVIAIACVLGIILILAAFLLASSYYEPVGNISRIVQESEGSSGKNEFENIISGIEALIGERNGYREKMVSIKPYARQGMLYGIMNGSLELEKVDLLLEDEYTVLQKPYFVLGVINVAYIGTDIADEAFYKKVKVLAGDIAKDNSGEDTSIFTYDKDINNLFVIVNSNIPEGMTDMFYKIYSSLVGRMDNPDYAITIGVDTVRDSISEINAAVSSALKALENIMAAGRGAVYFAENDSYIKSEYYFPKDTLGKVAQALKSKNISAIKDILSNIVDRNINDYDLSPNGARLLVDEIHITTLRAIREANLYNNIDFNIRKPDMTVPLEEILQYYCAIYETICEKIDEVAEEACDMGSIDNQIIECLDLEFADKNMSLQYLTEKFGMSNKYITLLCKKRFGKTYLAYIQEKRIDYAIELMKSGEYSLENVASKCGYTNLLTFRRNFKAVTGVNPSEYDI